MTTTAAECGVRVGGAAEDVAAEPLPSDFVFLPELLRRLGCSEDTFGRWRRLGLVPQPLANFPGRRLAWKRQAISDWLENMR